MGITVLSPDVNESFVEFAVVPGKKQIRFGMAAIKGVGVSAVEEILRARKDGKFESIEDFARRVSTSKVNKKSWESLVKTGAFDKFADRSDLLFNLETILAFASKLQKEAASGQTDLFGGLAGVAAIQPSLSLQTAPTKHTPKERLTWERELLGLYISAHPLDNYDAYFEEQTVPLIMMNAEIDGKTATIGGLISSVRTIITKSGTKMAFVKVEDKTSEGEVIVFPNLYEQIGAKLIQDNVIRATGKVTARDRDGNIVSDTKMIADDIQFVDEAELNNYESTGRKMNRPKPSANGVRTSRASDTRRQTKESTISAPVSTHMGDRPSTGAVPIDDNLALKKLFVHIKDPGDEDSLFQLKQTCNDFPGTTDIVLVLGEEKKSAIKLPFRVDGSDALVGRLVKILGEDAVVLK